jgi:hypothetical protein
MLPPPLSSSLLLDARLLLLVLRVGVLGLLMRLLLVPAAACRPALLLL